MAAGDGLIEDGIIKAGGANAPGWINNIALATATTSETGDSIKITSANGSAFHSGKNVGAVTLPSTTAGALITFPVPADITIDLTGAHWGKGTLGDLTDFLLSVYAINDAGTLKWGIAAAPNMTVILNADDNATASSITTSNGVLVNSALGSDGHCIEIGRFRANFTDTGGASEDLWVVQTGTDDIQLGSQNLNKQYFPQGTHNLGLAAAQTAVAADSIKITSADASALSINNVAYVTLPGRTSGLLETFAITADVTINLTGAHWGEGTNGDLTDYMLSVYAINDAGVLKWGVGSVPNHKTILNADDNATPTNITSIEKVLVNSALGADADALEVGWFKADFDDTDGSSEDLWVIQTSLGDITLGVRPFKYQVWTPVSDTWTTNTTYAGLWGRDGIRGFFKVKVSTSGAPDTAILRVDIPFTADTGQLINSAASQNILGWAAGDDDDGGQVYPVPIMYFDTNTVRVHRAQSSTNDITSGNGFSESLPYTSAANDSVTMAFELPISGW